MRHLSITRYHDISAGHRVLGHENKCSHLHGHNFRIHFTISSSQQDDIGRVLDFSAIKNKLCNWLEEHWDHKFLMYEKDPLLAPMRDLVPSDMVACAFNPTAENMAMYLCETVGPEQLKGTDCTLTKCVVEETRKCSATYSLSFP